ncbi:MAG: hypothetical protein E6Q83_13670 [Thiothrix sp.]|nr:MAG: hypothetical protein E6Q83_13670 [Thiothrix sp.]
MKLLIPSLLGLALSVAATTSFAATNYATKNAVWNASIEKSAPLFLKCSNANAPKQVTCLAEGMKKAGASTAAIDVMKSLKGDGYLMQFTEKGSIDLGTMAYPLRANTNEAAVLLMPNKLISTELNSVPPFNKDPKYATLKKKYPNLDIWPNSAQFNNMKKLSSGDTRFVFNYPVVDGCHACGISWHAEVALDVTQAGNLKTPQFLRLVADK